ncbi:hypothetical protein [Staphylococcus lutrae]|uniref:Uncharacterized protein n=1 Tax=Staphylococcus lutrae TaxID=155085 RepID=A0AAC9RUF6_9STAP|nr:hypothetical protein [Staphylococcus lutrae]ARJ51125.1 hypothetical protein B5P37_07320 [Staphylococcus lutrae]PNZ34816.1 hypothetical protein CD134_09975 [Staphylococcus lutrae]
MQHSLNVGDKETRVLHLDQAALARYCALFEKPMTSDVPLLFFARYWQAFMLFQPFMREPIILVETSVTQGQPIAQASAVEATLVWESYKPIKGFERYCFVLILPNENRIRQVFVKRVAE